MKNIFAICCLYLSAIQLVHAQQTAPFANISSRALYDNYIQKRKTFNTAGWVLLGAGAGMMIGGGTMYASYANQGYNGPSPASADALIIAGGVAALASIPLFISANKNKTKANLALKGESITFGNKIFATSDYYALALRINLSAHKRTNRK